MANRQFLPPVSEHDAYVKEAMEKKKFRSFDRKRCKQYEEQFLPSRHYESLLHNTAHADLSDRRINNLWGISLFNRKWQGAYFLTVMLGVIRYSGTLLIGDALHKHNLLGVLYAVYCLEDETSRRDALKKFLTISCRMEETRSDLGNQMEQLEAWRNSAMETICAATEKLSNQSNEEPYFFIFNAIPSDLAEWLEEQAIQLGNRWLQENSTAILLAIWLIDKQSRPDESVEESLSTEKWMNLPVEEKIAYVNKLYEDGRLPFNIARWADRWADYQDEIYEEKKDAYFLKMAAKSDLWKAALNDYEKSSRHIMEQLQNILSSEQAELDTRRIDERTKFIFSEYMITEGLKLTVLPKMMGYQRVLYPGKASQLVKKLGELFPESSKWDELIFERSKKKLCRARELFEFVLGIGPENEEAQKYLDDYWNHEVSKLIVNEYLPKNYLNTNIIKEITQKTIVYTLWNWNPTLTETEEKAIDVLRSPSLRREKNKTEIGRLKIRLEDLKEGCREISEQEIASIDAVKDIVSMGMKILDAPVVKPYLNSSKAWGFLKETVWLIVELVVSSEFFMKQFVSGLENKSSLSDVITQLASSKINELINLGNDQLTLEKKLIFKLQIADLFFSTYLERVSEEDMSSDRAGKLIDVAQTMGWIVMMIFSYELENFSEERVHSAENKKLLSSQWAKVEGAIEGFKLLTQSLINDMFDKVQSVKVKVDSVKVETVPAFLYSAFLRSNPMVEWREASVSVIERLALNAREDDIQLEKGKKSPTLTQRRSMLKKLEDGEILLEEFPQAVDRLTRVTSAQISRNLLSRSHTPTSIAHQGMWASASTVDDKKEAEPRSGISRASDLH